MYYGRLLPLCFTEPPLAGRHKDLFGKKVKIREGRFELPTKGSPRRIIHTLQSSALPLSYPRLLFWGPVCTPPIILSVRAKRKKKLDTPPLGIEPRTCRLTADRSANGALEACHSRHQRWHPFRCTHRFVVKTKVYSPSGI